MGGGIYHELARELRKNPTETERLLWSKLRGKQFFVGADLLTPPECLTDGLLPSECVLTWWIRNDPTARGAETSGRRLRGQETRAQQSVAIKKRIYEVRCC